MSLSYPNKGCTAVLRVVVYRLLSGLRTICTRLIRSCLQHVGEFYRLTPTSPPFGDNHTIISVSTKTIDIPIKVFSVFTIRRYIDIVEIQLGGIRRFRSTFILLTDIANVFYISFHLNGDTLYISKCYSNLLRINSGKIGINAHG